jgi:Na+/proline symporter
MLAQRIFTCRGPREARKAIVWSSGGVFLTLLLLFVGAGLFVYYRHHPLSAAEQAVVDAQSMKIFAVFIVGVLPVGVSGLLMAGIFATAISTLDSVLAALAQTTVSSVYRPLVRPDASDRHYLVVSRVLVILWGVVMTGFAIFCDYLQQSFGDLIQFALAMAAYTYGALLGVFLLAFLPTGRDDRGLLWGVPLSMLAILALKWHVPTMQIIVVVACLALVVFAFRELRCEPGKVLLVSFVAGLVMFLSLAVIGHDANGAPQFIELIWPWHFPIGTGITLGLGYVIGRPRKNP